MSLPSSHGLASASGVPRNSSRRCGRPSRLCAAHGPAEPFSYGGAVHRVAGANILPGPVQRTAVRSLSPVVASRSPCASSLAMLTHPTSANTPTRARCELDDIQRKLRVLDTHYHARVDRPTRCCAPTSRSLSCWPKRRPRSTRNWMPYRSAGAPSSCHCGARPSACWERRRRPSRTSGTAAPRPPVLRRPDHGGRPGDPAPAGRTGDSRPQNGATGCSRHTGKST